MNRSDLDGIEARARAAVAALSSAAIANARWSGLGGREPVAIELVEAFGFEDGGGLAILAATTVEGDREALHLTLPLADAPPWPGLHGLVAGGGTVTGARGGRLVGRPESGSLAMDSVDGSPGTERSIRVSPGDQSHTSVIVGERSILKLYRRLTPGPNPEAEVLEALSGVADAPVPAWRGSVEFIQGTGQSTILAIEQAFIAAAPDAFEVIADGLAAWLAGTAGPVATDIPRGTGIATGRLHAALSGLHRPGFETRAATREDRAGWLGTAEATFLAAVQAVAAVDAGLATRIEAAGPAIRAALRPLGDPSIPIRLQRIHGDLHLGQVLPGPDDVLLVDFEGDPIRDPRDRRALAAPLRDIAAFLRSIDHVARSGFRRAGALGNQPLGGGPLGPGASVALDAWIDAARAAFLEGYARGLGDPAWALDRDLLRAFEVEKELGEFVYAATFLPEWLYAPTGGLGALLGSPFQPVRAE